MQLRHTMVVGTEEPQDFALFDDGAALVGTGLDIGVEFRTTGLSAEKIAAIAALDVDWLSQAVGTVRITGIEGLPIGTYYFRFTLTDGAGDLGYAPNGSAADEWRVVKV